MVQGLENCIGCVVKAEGNDVDACHVGDMWEHEVTIGE
jgi:hypothetical protein